MVTISVHQVLFYSCLSASARVQNITPHCVAQHTETKSIETNEQVARARKAELRTYCSECRLTHWLRQVLGFENTERRYNEMDCGQMELPAAETPDLQRPQTSCPHLCRGRYGCGVPSVHAASQRTCACFQQAE